jgi:hypothetical protein
MLLNIVKDEMIRNLCEMTYNFDPDRWLENEITFLENSYKSGKISELEYETSLEKLHIRHEEMWNRLDGTYRIPSEKFHGD